MPRTFRAHLSLVSHDMYVRPDLSEEAEEYVRGLPVPFPESFPGDAVTLYRTRSDDWTGRWWQTLTWEHVHRRLSEAAMARGSWCSRGFSQGPAPG
ncbi:hypothetical protein GCM10023080_018210 [Streptomyces pseudoechinosporeus]